jgi:hypothetical protein
MNLRRDATTGRAGSWGGGGRRIPTWAAGLLAGLARDQPQVLTRADIAERLAEAGSDRAVDRTIEELRRLGWLRPIGLHAVWAFVPPGQDEVVDPYLVLRGWRAKDPSVVFRLAGDASAWHLGYLNRRPTGPVPVWLPKSRRIPDGLRGSISAVRFPWPVEQADELGPRPELLTARKLDALTWSSRLPALGPEALLVQLATRPSSFTSWADLVEHLSLFAADIDIDRATMILRKQSTSSWQRAAYLLHCGGQPRAAMDLLANRPPREMPTVVFGEDVDPQAPSLFAPQFRIVDRLIAPLQGLVGKA